MSRSYRKTPIFGDRAVPSEARDKRTWHKRHRAHERDQGAQLTPASDPLRLHHREVSNPRFMAKDEKSYHDARSLLESAERAATRASTPTEYASLVARHLARYRYK